MNHTNPKIAVVGTGVIGASWATCFLAHGYDVAATDPADGAEERLRTTVAQQWPAMKRIGLSEGASPDRLSFHTDLAEAVKDAFFIQESGPEREDIKRETIRQIDAAAPPDAIIASSSSGIRTSDVQDAASRPERVLLGHPFNPPHLIPLVEVAGGKLTAPEFVERAMQFYADLGKKPIQLQREVPGHIANRLQAALWREAFHLVSEGVASVSDIDAAIAHGPGLRWALLGPFLNLHLSGGDRGIRHALEHLGPPIENWWEDQGDVKITPALIQALGKGVDEELSNSDLAEVVSERNDILLTMLELKNRSKLVP